MLIEEVEATRIGGEATTWPYDVCFATIPQHYPGGLLFGTQGEQVAPARDSGGLYASLEALSARVEPAPDPLKVLGPSSPPRYVPFQQPARVVPKNPKGSRQIGRRSHRRQT